MIRARMIEEMGNGEFVYWTRFYAREQQQREIEGKMSG